MLRAAHAAQLGHAPDRLGGDGLFARLEHQDVLQSRLARISGDREAGGAGSDDDEIVDHGCSSSCQEATIDVAGMAAEERAIGASPC